MMHAGNDSGAVVKVGGSLFDLPQLGTGLRRWIMERREPKLLLVPGGGAMADVVRSYHRTHQLSQERSHWLAIQTMKVNAELLRALLGNVPILGDVQEASSSGPAIVDAFRFMERDESHPDRLPHTWQVTSDAIAARVAERAGVKRIIMLKSVDMIWGDDWDQAVLAGAVDPMFPQIVRSAGLAVEWINLRTWVTGVC